MADSSLRQVFLVNVPTDKGDDLIAVDAVQVYNIEGDLIFTDEEGIAIDMIASGHWSRCKVGKLE